MVTEKNIVVYVEDSEVVAINLKKPFIKREGNFRLYNAIQLNTNGGHITHIETTRGRHLGKKSELKKLSKELQKKIINELN